MALDIAYSLEIEDYIDPDRTYDLYWSGILKDSKSFVCPGTNCLAQVTCANLYGDSQSMKVVPHFRVYGKVHHQDCEIINNKELSFSQDDISNQSNERKSVDNSIVDRFFLKRPDSYYDSEINIGDVFSSENQKKIRAKKIIKSDVLKETGIIGSIYSVRTIVSRFIRYTKDGSINNRFINIKGENVSYNKFLLKVWSQKITDLPEMDHIYHGWAYIDKYEKGYRVKFIKNFKDEKGNELITTFFIFDNLIKKYKIKNLVINRIKKIVSMPKPTAYVFVFGKPKIFESKKTGKKYASFKVENLDYIDVNINSPI